MATTFYSQIGANKRNSVLLALAVMGLLGLLGMVIGYALVGDPLGAAASMVFAIVVGLGASLVSYYAGSSIVLAASGAREVTAQELPQLYNVVQEMALAASVPMPKVYLIDDTAPNAFATGRDPEHASVAITIGLLQKLDREELQGVMAHELSHVRNFDIRFSLMVGVLVGSIALLADFFLRFTFWGGGGRRRSSDSDSGGGGLQVVFLIIALALAILAPIAARMVQMAISRQREYLADASGVELTRNPYGLERALAKIALDTEPLEVANRATQHLYFENPIKGASGKSSNLWSTHPPVLERINRLRELTSQSPLSSPEQALADGLPAARAVPPIASVPKPPPPPPPFGGYRPS
jgi:heat shock protein HtpX